MCFVLFFSQKNEKINRKWKYFAISLLKHLYRVCFLLNIKKKSFCRLYMSMAFVAFGGQSSSKRKLNNISLSLYIETHIHTSITIDETRCLLELWNMVRTTNNIKVLHDFPRYGVDRCLIDICQRHGVRADCGRSQKTLITTTIYVCSRLLPEKIETQFTKCENAAENKSSNYSRFGKEIVGSFTIHILFQSLSRK